jgi:hypothetical protein
MHLEIMLLAKHKKSIHTSTNILQPQALAISTSSGDTGDGLGRRPRLEIMQRLGIINKN